VFVCLSVCLSVGEKVVRKAIRFTASYVKLFTSGCPLNALQIKIYEKLKTLFDDSDDDDYMVRFQFWPML